LYEVDGLAFTPTNILESNLIAGANMTITKGAKGRLTFASTGGSGSTTNYNGLYITNKIFGTNYTFTTTTITNGLNINVILKTTARSQGAHTNLYARAWFDPAPR